MTDYAVGDIQGCLKPLKKCLAEVEFNPSKDVLWVAGDLVNRGPDSLGTLKFIKKMDNAARVVLGNHDLHLVAVYYGIREPNRKDTLDDILAYPKAKALIKWLCQQPLIQHDPALGYTMVHAGIPHIWSTKKAVKYGQEILEVLEKKKSRLQFLNHMYGNLPEKWDKSLRGPERWRLITNYFTRMRFIGEQGELNLVDKLGPTLSPPGMAAWFDFEPRKPRKTQILFGHWAALEGMFDHPRVIGLDTGAVWGGVLSLLNLQTGEIVQH